MIGRTGVEEERYESSLRRVSARFTGPLWATDWTNLAAEYREALPARVRDLILRDLDHGC
ncbi:hypothetical protein [Streptomyces sp. NPDC060031]|uniref:hypothetical protein n=1 Tax=Streptomyces sp. NPDC060031 TaxID=3347043 RepID=UPI00369C970C